MRQVKGHHCAVYYIYSLLITKFINWSVQHVQGDRRNTMQGEPGNEARSSDKTTRHERGHASMTQGEKNGLYMQRLKVAP